MFRDETERVETDSLAACRIAVLTLNEDNRERRGRDKTDKKAGKMAGWQSKHAPPARTGQPSSLFLHFSAFSSTWISLALVAFAGDKNGFLYPEIFEIVALEKG